MSLTIYVGENGSGKTQLMLERWTERACFYKPGQGDPITRESDGEGHLRAIQWIVDHSEVYDGRFIFDTPEAFLSLKSIRKVAGLLLQLSRAKEVHVATHSNDMIWSLVHGSNRNDALHDLRIIIMHAYGNSELDGDTAFRRVIDYGDDLRE